MFWIQEKSHYQKPPVEPKIIFLLIAKKKSKNTLKNWGIGLMKKRLGDIELENRTTFLHEIIRWFATTEKSDAIITKPPILILLFSWSCMRGILYCCSGQSQQYPCFPPNGWFLLGTSQTLSKLNVFFSNSANNYIYF